MGIVSSCIKHEPCPRCRSYGGDRSGNNLAVYPNNKWCFSCKLYIKTGPSIPAQIGSIEKTLINQGVKPLPDDAAPPLGAVAWRWLKKYGITDEDVEANNFKWSDDKQWLIYPFYDEIGDMLAWQARNFNVDRPKPKYWTAGKIEDVFVFYGKGDTLILTEDVISAIKVGRSSGIVGMPIFGSNVSLKRIVRLATQFKSVGIWLDMDKSRESVLARSRASQFIPYTFTILTKQDPKEYTDRQITEIILSNLMMAEPEKDEYRANLNQ